MGVRGSSDVDPGLGVDHRSGSGREVKRRALAATALVLTAGLLLGLGFAWIIGSLKDADQDVAALRAQILSMGETPVVGPTGEPGKPGDQGEVGPRGDVGPRGPAGEDGAPGLTPGCVFAPTQCVGPAGPVGPSGPAGAQGPVGPAGADGQDGTDGAPGPQGPQGPQGEPGPMGPQGPAGTDGQPPASFTFTWANRTYTCTDSDGDRNYECVDNDPAPA